MSLDNFSRPKAKKEPIDAKDAFIQNNIKERKLIFDILKSETNISISIADNAGQVSYRTAIDFINILYI